MHTIELKELDKKLCAQYYRRSRDEHRFIEEEVSKFLEKGLIRRSNSETISPGVLAKKKDGSVRFCFDYRNLNANTSVRPFLIPRIDESSDGIAGSRYYTALDLESGHHQIKVAENRKANRIINKRRGIRMDAYAIWACKCAFYISARDECMYSENICGNS